MNNNILQYESKVWATADLLIGAGIKQSDFPKFMMPFFALIMVESRLLRMAAELKEEFEDEDLEDFLEEVKDQDLGYNDLLLRRGKTLASICQNDKTFDIDFQAYLESFDEQTRYLLGVNRGNTEEKFLDISGISGQLKKKRILLSSVTEWSEIDLTPFNNSEITTLEEHIKRKWADISADTAGEQYTPDDIIALIAAIVCDKIEDDDNFLNIYDPTCGGGNLLFGVEDAVKEKFSRPTKTYGQDWSDSLYALAKIESRFRGESDIRYGNTLVDIFFSDKHFDVAVANPPYGVDWKGYQKDIKNDQTGRFIALPSVSDGQLLFMQHLVAQLGDKGLGVVVHNGSTLFSGDAGSGESTIRKWLFDQDYVEAIIQLPTDEFFNTSIHTYLWIINKAKAVERRHKIMLINASMHYVGLKKNKGSKRKEISEINRKEIVETLRNYQDTDFAKVFPRAYFYYNKQAIMLTNVDENGKSFEEMLSFKQNKQGKKGREKSMKLIPVKITAEGDEDTDSLVWETFRWENTTVEKVDEIKEKIKQLDYKDQDLRVYTVKSVYHFDAKKSTLIETIDGKETALGCGKIVIKAKVTKRTKTRSTELVITVELTPDYQKDYEVITWKENEVDNEAGIDAFLKKYIFKPYAKIGNTVGVEINFNKVFYKPKVLRSVEEIQADLDTIDEELEKLEKQLEV